jgi:hypothetical protein
MYFIFTIFYTISRFGGKRKLRKQEKSANWNCIIKQHRTNLGSPTSPFRSMTIQKNRSLDTFHKIRRLGD